MGLPNYDPPINISELWPESIQSFANCFSQCFTELTQSRQSWWNPVRWIPLPTSAANKGVRTLLFTLKALDGDLEPLLKRVLDVLIIAFNQSPLD